MQVHVYMIEEQVAKLDAKIRKDSPGGVGPSRSKVITKLVEKYVSGEIEL